MEQDINALNEENNAPLHWACLNGHIQVTTNQSLMSSLENVFRVAVLLTWKLLTGGEEIGLGWS